MTPQTAVASHGTPSPWATFVREDNPGLMTLDGTNTWVLRRPDAPPGALAVVVDPGELDEEHLGRVLSVAAPVGLVLLTHHHHDHTEGAERFAELSGAPVRAVDPALCRGGGETLTDGETVEVDGVRLEVLATPGHTRDSVSFLLRDDASLLTGDTVLGRGTTVVAHPDGALGPYLASLAALRAVVDTLGGPVRLLPGHGPVQPDAGAVLDAYVTHRAERLDQVRAALDDGAQSVEDVVRIVYADVDEALWPAASRSVAAQLDYLRGDEQ
ncbi:glyoxylase-like metal-dependent hydrolase (beta-lactamase superfamily II) [Mumia flava]|uniref:Glyoxylase-like metal-dependent hydrolase (Beta-lactamase superfamily II) n=1 Tax=Mumia flava TaxID=1348852 RepID=A0A0B2BJL4_9ACTN|nr:MBL fold metallo-hydrolase [Mumia flava]PJJ57396.1 glyoxylase-like metal-dependent hydrolase (beta-lactamase superfamily II) [Mumia flava]